MHTLISTDQLAQSLTDPATVVFDASFYLPTEPQNAQALFAQAHIPGAAFFDVDTIADRTSPLPHMAPPADEFAATVAAFGVSNSSSIVVYDQRGLFSAARVWWLFRLFGHDNVRVLDGGLPKWRLEGRTIETGAAQPRPPGRFIPHIRPDLVRDRAAIEANLTAQTETLLDARAAGRFTGVTPEPRPGMRSGHVPKAVSLPFTTMLNQDGTMKPEADLRAIFGAAGVTEATSPITMCGSGVTGAVLSLGLVHAGLPAGSLYDGSWAEWGADANTPIETTA